MDAMREKALRDRVSELEETVRQLRDQLAPKMDWMFLGLSAAQSRILSALYVTAPETVAYERFETFIERGPLSSQIKHMRLRLKPVGVGIAVRYCDGYALSAADKTKLAAARAAHEAGIPLGKTAREIAEHAMAADFGPDWQRTMGAR